MTHSGGQCVSKLLQYILSLCQSSFLFFFVAKCTFRTSTPTLFTATCKNPFLFDWMSCDCTAGAVRKGWGCCSRRSFHIPHHRHHPIENGSSVLTPRATKSAAAWPCDTRALEKTVRDTRVCVRALALVMLCLYSESVCIGLRERDGDWDTQQRHGFKERGRERRLLQSQCVESGA